jgi:hypothetical protein
MGGRRTLEQIKNENVKSGIYRGNFHALNAGGPAPYEEGHAKDTIGEV